MREGYTVIVRCLLLVLMSLLTMACTDERPSPQFIDLERTVALPTELDRRLESPLQVAIAAVISPTETLASYSELLDYLSARLNHPVELVQRATYGEVNELLRQGKVDLALICTLAYVEGKEQFGLEVIAAPQVAGRAVYYSYLLVPFSSPAQRLEDLEGGVFAFTDPLSTTGHLVPEYWLSMLKRRPEEFFRKTIFTYSHDRAIRAVADRLVDGAAVDHLVYEAKVEQDPALAQRVRVIRKSDPFGTPPVVVGPNVAPAVKQAVTEVLLGMDSDEEGARILRQLRVERWVQPPDSAYDPIRAMVRVVGRP